MRRTDGHNEANSPFYFGILRTRPEMTRPATQYQLVLRPVQLDCWVRLSKIRYSLQQPVPYYDTRQKPTGYTPKDDDTPYREHFRNLGGKL